jgi:hypothetical protein
MAHIYKRKYSDQQVGDVAERAHPVMKMMRKVGGMSGPAAGHFYMIRYGNPQAVSGGFTSAQDNISSSSGKQLQATRRKKYGIIRLDGEALCAAEDNRGAFLDLVSQETDGIIEEVADSLAREMYGDGNGQLGRRASASTNVITVGAGQARNFKVGMTVVADDTAAGSSLRSGSTTVAEVDEDSETVTLTSAAAITAFADNDYLFRIGDPGTVIDGFESHIPLTAPTSGESFRGIDRADHVRLLAGSRIDDTSTSIEENAGSVCVKIAQSSKAGGKGTKILALNPTNWWKVSRRLNAKISYDGGGNKATFGFEGFDIATAEGVVRAISDPDCPENRGRIICLAEWYWKHLKPWIHVIRDDKGQPSLRVYNDDAVETRIRAMGNTCTRSPASDGVFSI